MMRSNGVRRLVLVCAAALAMGCMGLAQSTTQGAIGGTVFDASGAIVPGATILIHNNGNDAEQKLTSDSSGFFKAPQLPPGTYTVTISAPGFSEVRSTNVTVQVNLVTEFDQHLQAGGAEQTVEVTSEAPVLNFEDPTYGGHLSNIEIESIPINNRRWSTLALLTPGATVDLSGFGLIQFRAISPLLNNVEIDGADDNQAYFSEERGRTRVGYSTSQAAVREFTVNSGVYSSEFGRAVGGVINSVTKSGANQLHGELYFYNRDSSRSAFQFGSTITTFNATTNQYVNNPYKPTDKRNQYGFGAGGALIKDRLFWFYAFDTFHRNFPGVAKANNPAAFFTAPDSTLPTGLTCNAATGAVTGTGASTIDQQNCLLSARLGVSYTTAAADYNQQLQNALADLGNVPRFGNQEINTPKLDFQINPKNHLSFLYHRMRWDSPGGVQTAGTVADAVDYFGTDFVKLDYGLVELESVFGRVSNELRYQYGRELDDEGRQTPSSYTNNFLTPSNSGGVPVGVSIYTTTGFSAGTPYYSFRFAYPDERKWQVGDTAAITLGRHNVKFGGDILHNYDLQNNLFQGNGAYTYSTNVVNYFSDLIAKHGTCNSALSGVGTLPCYNSYAQGFGPAEFDLSTLDYGFFVQDDWKLSPRLTVNLGARYDYQKLPGPFTNVANANLPQAANTPSDKNNISPRVGFAWDPYGAGKTVVRGGYGLYYGRIINAALLNARYTTGAPNTQLSFSYNNSTSVNSVSIAPTFPNIATVAPAAAAGALSVQYLDNHLQNPYTEQFDLAVQQELGSGLVLSVSYIGALGRELPNYLNFNLNPADTYTFTYNVAPAAATTNCGPIACGTQIPVKVYSTRTQTASCAATASCTGTYVSNTLNPAFSAVTDLISNINSSYHGLTTEIQKRANKVFAFDVNYTWSHALDYAQNASTSAGTNNWLDPYSNARENYGNSNFNFPQRAVGWALINFPGTSGGNLMLKYLSNGWSLKPLVQAQTGAPYSVTVGGTTPNQCYYTAGCLQAAGSGLGGTGITYIPLLGRNTFHQPTTIQADMRAEKDFTFAERYNLQLIGEAFNLPNHLNITGLTAQGYTSTVTQGSPTVAPTANLVFQPTFQAVTTANNNYAYSPRQIQLALRLTF